MFLTTLQVVKLMHMSLSKGSSGSTTYLFGKPSVHGGNVSDPSTWASPTYPNLKVRYWATNTVNDRTVTVYTDEISPWVPNHDPMTSTPTDNRLPRSH